MRARRVRITMGVALLLADGMCNVPAALGQLLQPLLPAEFRAAVATAEKAAAEAHSVTPVLKLFDVYKEPAEVAEVEMSLGMLYDQRTGLVDPVQAVLHLGKALQYDLPERERLQALMWRQGSQQQLGRYDAAREDLLRILLICSYHDLPDSSEGIGEPKPKALTSIGEPADPERALDYDYYREQNSYQDFLLLSRYAAIEAIRHLQKVAGFKDEEIRETLEELSPSVLRQEVVKRWLASENRKP